MKSSKTFILSIARKIVEASERWSGTELKSALEFVGEWIVRNRLSRYLPTIQEEVQKILLEKKGAVAVQVRSARPLDEAAKKTLVPLLSQLLGKEAQCHYKQDPTVVGGVRAQTDTHLIRASVADALQTLI